MEKGARRDSGNTEQVNNSDYSKSNENGGGIPALGDSGDPSLRD